MTDDAQAAIREWEARRHANEVDYWAEHLEEFVKRLPTLRRIRGDDWAGRLVADVLAALVATHGALFAHDARARLMGRWSDSVERQGQ